MTTDRIAIMTAADLESLVERVVARATKQPADEWMSADDVAALLGVKRSTIPTLVRRDGLPCYRPGKAYTFRRSEVVAWLEVRRRGHAPANLRAIPGGRRGG